MEAKQLREIPLKNYFILGVVVVVSILLLYYFYMWVVVYNKTRLSNPIMDESMEVIHYNELNNYLVENPNAIIYVSKLEDSEIRNFEIKFKKIIKDVNKDLLYMNITEELKDDALKKEIRKKYSLNGVSIVNVPSIMVFDNGKLMSVYSIVDNSYDVGKVKKFINGTKYSSEEVIDG